MNDSAAHDKSINKIKVEIERLVANFYILSGNT